MSHSLVWNLVDDSDSCINYSRGKWMTASGGTIPAAYANSLDEISTAGDVFNNTLHASGDVGSEFSFRFNGTGLVLVYGTLVIPNNLSTEDDDSSDSGSGGFVKIDCLLDGQQKLVEGINWPIRQLTLGNNQLICRMAESAITSGIITSEGNQEGLVAPEEHELVVKVTSLDNNSTFYLDYLVYEPLPVALLDGGGMAGGDGDGGVLQIGNAETGLAPTIASEENHGFELGSGWQTGGQNFSTTAPGSVVTVRFNGTEILMYGDLSGNSSNAATYQLDNEDPKILQLFPKVKSGQAFTKQQFFNLSSLSPAMEHTLVVKHNGTADGMPLSFDYFLVTSPTAAERGGFSSASPGGPLWDFSGDHSKPVGAIVGSTFGGIVAIALITIVVFFLIRKHRTRRRLTAPSSDTLVSSYRDSFPSSPHPLMATAPTPPIAHAYLPTRMKQGQRGTPPSYTEV
ncbi:hypothetical protein D9758_009767 [Tetrapyrgos nigripes]|uniref:Uncharacterized protein n=1 Tax=Tetrapyrgos nigripes TaxID=182062 RepID=A0A8H5GK07_9AGAR|nr:hypothetical protein D9758_009767 [Tetrapyrgos nigripes]